VLWNCGLLADLIKKEFEVTVSERTVGLHLKALVLPITNNVRNYSDLVYWKPLFLTYRIVDAWPQTNTLAAPS